LELKFWRRFSLFLPIFFSVRVLPGDIGMQQMRDDTRGTGAVSSTSCKVTELGTGLGAGRPPAVSPASPAGCGRGPNAAGKARRAGSGLHLLFFLLF